MLQVVVPAILLFLAWLFATAGYHKLRDAGYYREVLREYLPWAQRYGRLPVFLLGAVEVVLAVLLLIDWSRRAAVLAAIALLTVYAIGMAVQLVRGRADLHCGCSGPASEVRIGRAPIYRNIVVIAIAALCLLPAQLSLAIWQWPLMGGAAVFLTLVYAATDQLIANHQKMTAAWG